MTPSATELKAGVTPLLPAAAEQEVAYGSGTQSRAAPDSRAIVITSPSCIKGDMLKPGALNLNGTPLSRTACRSSLSALLEMVHMIVGIRYLAEGFDC